MRGWLRESEQGCPGSFALAERKIARVRLRGSCCYIPANIIIINIIIRASLFPRVLADLCFARYVGGICAVALTTEAGEIRAIESGGSCKRMYTSQ